MTNKDDRAETTRSDAEMVDALTSLSRSGGKPQSDAEPTHRDMAYFGASEAAGYYYPGEDQQLLRDAYCRGAAEYAPKPSDAEPVAWQYRCRTNELSTWSEWKNCNQELADQLILKKPPFYEVRRSLEPVAWPDIDAAVKAGLATRHPAPDAAPSTYSNTKTVTIDSTAPHERMTDEERKKLCADLQLIANDEIEGESWTGLKCKEAAREIERLAAEVKRWEALQEWQDPPSWIGGPTKVKAANPTAAKAMREFK